MKPVSPAELLRIWEEGLDQPLLEKTLRLLANSCAVADHHEISRLSIGERDARLLLLREWMFGKRLQNIADCPACAATTEWETNAEDLHLQPLSAELAVRTFDFDRDGYSIHFRLPDSNDMARLINDKANRNDEKKLLSDCLLAVNYNGYLATVDQLPDAIIDELNKQMAAEDPQADIRMLIHCPVCPHQWEARFDIVSFLWAEINNWAQRLMQEICILAKTFGWAEKDILNMGVRRRQLYLQMIAT